MLYQKNYSGQLFGFGFDQLRVEHIFEQFCAGERDGLVVVAGVDANAQAIFEIAFVVVVLLV